MFTKFIEDFLTKDECDFLISLGESTGLQQMKSSKIVNGILIEKGVEYIGNKRMGCYFINEILSNPTLLSISNKLISISNNLNPYKGITYTSIPKYSFNRYSMGDFLEWHEDRHEIINGATITFIIQLNDDYENGNVKYKIDNMEYIVEKKQGSIFIFDSNIEHCVDNITNGTRYSINVWPSSVKKISLL